MAAGLESDVLVSSYIIALTSPPDARYSPLTKAPAGPAPPSSFDQVRALVLPVAPDAAVTKVMLPLMALPVPFDDPCLYFLMTPACTLPVPVHQYYQDNTACGIKPAHNHDVI